MNPFAHAQLDLNSFLVMLKTVVFVMHSFVETIMIAVLEFVAMVNVQSLVEIKTIVLTENIVQTIDA